MTFKAMEEYVKQKSRKHGNNREKKFKTYYRKESCKKRFDTNDKIEWYETRLKSLLREISKLDRSMENGCDQRKCEKKQENREHLKVEFEYFNYELFKLKLNMDVEDQLNEETTQYERIQCVYDDCKVSNCYSHLHLHEFENEEHSYNIQKIIEYEQDQLAKYKPYFSQKN